MLCVYLQYWIIEDGQIDDLEAGQSEIALTVEALSVDRLERNDPQPSVAQRRGIGDLGRVVYDVVANVSTDPSGLPYFSIGDVDWKIPVTSPVGRVRGWSRFSCQLSVMDEDDQERLGIFRDFEVAWSVQRIWVELRHRNYPFEGQMRSESQLREIVNTQKVSTFEQHANTILVLGITPVV